MTFHSFNTLFSVKSWRTLVAFQPLITFVPNGTGWTTAAGPKKRQREGSEKTKKPTPPTKKPTKPIKKKKSSPPPPQVSTAADKNYDHVIRVKLAAIRRKHGYAAAYNEASAFRKKHANQPWTDELDREYSQLVMRAYEVIQACEAEQTAFKQQALEAYQQLTPSEKRAKVWAELNQLPPADRPAWMDAV